MASRRTGQRARTAASVAAALACASALTSFYWAAGGTLLLGTVGGEIEDTAREGGPLVVLVAGGAGLAKLVAAVLALALVRDVGRRWFVRLPSAAGALVLAAYGTLLTGTGALALAGAFGPVDAASVRALRWHALFWDPWFLLWGVAWGLAWWWTRPTTGLWAGSPHLEPDGSSPECRNPR